MIRNALAISIVAALALTASAQTTRPVPRPPAQQPGAPPAGSAAADGYSPIPEWAGQTKAPRVSVSVPFAVDVVSTGIANGYSIEFMPDGRILLVERPGRLKIIDRSGRISAPVAGLPPIHAGGPQGLVGAIADREFTANRTVYLAYTAPDPNASSLALSKVEGPLPRLAGVLTIARARLSADSSRLEDVRVLLNAEGIGGRMIQSRDGTLLISSSIPAGVGILSEDYNGAAINKDRTSQAGMEQPVYFWTPDIAPGGISFYNGKLFPGWQGNLFVAALAGKHLARLVLQGDRVIGEERLLTDLDARIRDVKEGPDEALYVLTDRDEGRLLRLVPQKASAAKGQTK